jgi:hypothetical protein
LVTLLLQHSKVVHANFLGEEEGKSMKLVLEKSASFSLSAAFIPLLNAKEVFGCWIKAVFIPLLSYPWAGFYSHSPLG